MVLGLGLSRGMVRSRSSLSAALAETAALKDLSHKPRIM